MFRNKAGRCLALGLLGLSLLAGCTQMANHDADTEETPTAEIAEIVESTEEPVLPEPAKLRISELMVKNRAVLRDEDGDFSDWVEIENYGDELVSLKGYYLSDQEWGGGLPLSGIINPGELHVVWASGKDRSDKEHGNFSLSRGETVYLIDPYGRVVSSAPCLTEIADRAVALEEDGAYRETPYSTPRWPNSAEGFIGRQETLSSSSPLQINEVCVYNPGWDSWRLFSSDWVELKNVSEEKLLLSDYCLSDNFARLDRYRLPEKYLSPGGIYLIRCDANSSPYLPDPSAGFALGSESEQLYLSNLDGELLDWVTLQGIPFGGSYGRMPGEAGWFYFDEPSPASENRGGCRRVSEKPRAIMGDGVYNGVEEVTVALTAPGEIYYTFGDEQPTTASTRYEGPFTVSKTTVVRAFAVEEGAIPSRTASFSFILNEEHTLPIMSVVTDSVRDFNLMYYNGVKGREIPATLTLYDGEHSFSEPCGLRLHGETSLRLGKKNMAVFFRTCYGQSELEQDVYGGGVQNFGSFVLRSGQDYFSTAVKNALGQNLCLQAGNRALTTRSKFCILYINGRYWGVYNLMEKTNEEFYSNLMNVSKESVEVIEAPAATDSSLYRELFDVLRSMDLSVPENYGRAKTLVDVESVIDWIVIEGYCANTDLTFGNLRYARSSEGDGKWRLMLYDLDATFLEPEACFSNMLSQSKLTSRQVSAQLVRPLLDSPEFREQLLTRAGQLLGGVLSSGNVTNEYNRLVGLIEPEIGRDYELRGMSKNKWEVDVGYLREMLASGRWNESCVNQICACMNLTPEERAHYFGGTP